MEEIVSDPNQKLIDNAIWGKSQRIKVIESSDDITVEIFEPSKVRTIFKLNNKQISWGETGANETGCKNIVPLRCIDLNAQEYPRVLSAKFSEIWNVDKNNIQDYTMAIKEEKTIITIDLENIDFHSLKGIIILNNEDKSSYCVDCNVNRECVPRWQRAQIYRMSIKYPSN